jgi:Flp pilus assembly protein TadG
MIELAIILPILMLLCFGSAELCHAILFNNILINMSREGANLASRTTQSPQFIIDALNNTSAPLQMEVQGMIFITRVKGVDAGAGSVIAVVDEQYRAVRGNAALMSRLWTCPQWDAAGKCTLPTSVATRVVTLPFTLGVGYEVQVVEAIYDYAPLTNLFLTTAPQLYSVTLL